MKHRLDPAVLRVIWERVCRDATDTSGRIDEALARQRFHEVAVRIAERAGLLRPCAGKVTRYEAEALGDIPQLDLFAAPVPGRTTQVLVEARRWERRAHGVEAPEDPAPLPRQQEIEALSVGRELGEPDDNATSNEPQIAPSGSPSELPYRPTLEALFGTSLGGVRAYLGQRAELGRHSAHGAAWRESVAFADAPTLPMVAHEVAHVLQLRGTAPTRARSSTGDASEREADAVAHAVARGAHRVSVHATRTAALSFSPDAGPPQTQAPVTLAGAVYDAIDRVQKTGKGLGDAFAANPNLATTIGKLGQGSNAPAICDAVVTGAAAIGGFIAHVATKGQKDPAAITLNDLLMLLGNVFQSPELEAYGLPTSFGSQVALDPIVAELTEAFDDALRAAAPLGQDAAAIKATVTKVIAAHQAMIEAAIEQVAGSWDDPMDLVDLELKGAIAKLGALRGELASARSPAEQAAIGGKIAPLARYVLLLSDKLGDPNQRIKRRTKRGPAASLDTMRGAAATLSNSRAVIGSEKDTLEGLGNSADLLGERLITAVDPTTAAPVSETVRPEEAFAHHTDQLMAKSQMEINWQGRRQDRELAAMKASLAPRGVKSYAQFVPVYERWFGFFSRAEREDQAGAFMQLYIQATSLMGLAGISGYAARIGTQMAVSAIGIPSGVSDDFAREPSAIPLKRTVAVDGRATRDGNTDVSYGFKEEARGHEDGDEASSRNGAVNERMAQRRAATDKVYQARQGREQDDAVVQGGLAPGRAPGEPRPALSLYSKKDCAEGRDGAKTRWNYILIANVGHATGKLEQVYEHKVMRDDVARYLLAAAQHLQTLTQRHEIKDPKRADAPRLGDAAGRGGDVMASTASASAIYGDPKDRRSSEDSAAARTSFAAQQQRALRGGDRRGAMATTTRELRTSLEASMDQFFAAASGGEKLKAIILDIAVKEHGLDAAIWQHVQPEVLWEFAKQAIKMAAIFWALERLGPVGMIASALFQRAMYSQDKRQFIAAAMAFAAWLDGATNVRSFREAQGWAFTFTPIADSFAQALRDWVAQKMGHGIAKKIGDAYTATRTEPRTVGEMHKELEPILSDAKVKREVAQQIETELTARLKEGKARTADDQKLLAILYAVDPAPHGRVASRFKGVPKLTTESPLANDPSLSAHTPIHLVEVQREVRTYIDEHLGRNKTIQPYTVEALTPADFAKKFQSEKGRSMVTVVENGHAVVYVRADARPRDFADEAIHLVQLNDPKSPKLGEHIRTLSEATLGQWQKYDVELRKQLFERKIAVEIDAKERRLAEMQVSAPDWKPIHDELTNLQALEARSKAITDEQLLATKASGKQPDFLDDPAWLFAKDTMTVNTKLNTPGVDAGKLATKTVHDSPAGKFGVVKQLGEPWTEVTVITASNGGKVKVEAHTVSVDGRRYVFEDGSTIHVKTGDTVQAGQLLVTEPALQYRTVTVEKPNGTTDQRLEIFSKKRNNKWVQAGEHSTRRGALVEKAARNQLHNELTAEKQAAADPHNPASRDPNRLVEFVRVENQTPQGGGFDDVLIEFRGHPPTATIRIVEVKDYPNRNVWMGEMTAIRENRSANLRRVRGEIDAAVHANTPGERPEAFRTLTADQIRALSIAEATNNFRVELRLGPSTEIGAEGHSAATILSKLRAELKASPDFGGRDVLDTAPPKMVDQKAIDAVAE